MGLLSRLFGSPNTANIVVYVMPRNTGGGVIDWDVGFTNPPPPGKEPIELDEDSGGHNLVFRSVRNQQQGLEFDFDTADPIWVHEGNGCPPGPGIHTEQIKIKESASGKRVRVHDKNCGRARRLGYQLNFLPAGTPACDPIIENGGGTGNHE